MKATFTVVPFLVAMVIALVGMPTNVVQACYSGLGIEHAQPWRSKALNLARKSVALLKRFTEALASCLRHEAMIPLAVAALLLVALVLTSSTAHATTLLAVAPVVSIKQLTQDEADKLKAITKLKQEGRALFAVAEKDRTPEQKTRLEAVLGTDLTALEVELETIQANLQIAKRLQDDERALASRVEVLPKQEKPITLGQFLQGMAFMHMGKASLLSPEVQAAVSGASSGAPQDGGFLVRADWNTSLLNKMQTLGVLAPRCLSIPIGPEADGIEAPYVNETSRATGSRWGGVQVFRAAEAATVTATKPGLGKFELRLEDLFGLFYATDRLLRDTTALEAIALKAFPSEFAFKLDDEIVRGDGAGQCLGILNAPALVTVAKESGQTAGTIKAENVIKMYARMLASAIGQSAWFINQECLPQLQQMYVAAGTAGQLVYMPPNGLVDAPFGSLLGRPVIPIEQCSGLGSVGDIIFASLGENYVLIDKPMTSASSEHVRFIYNEKTFKWVYPIIGRPLLQSAITPYKATTATTLSPFVALAAR